MKLQVKKERTNTTKSASNDEGHETNPRYVSPTVKVFFVELESSYMAGSASVRINNSTNTPAVEDWPDTNKGDVLLDL